MSSIRRPVALVVLEQLALSGEATTTGLVFRREVTLGVRQPTDARGQHINDPQTPTLYQRTDARGQPSNPRVALTGGARVPWSPRKLAFPSDEHQLLLQNRRDGAVVGMPAATPGFGPNPSEPPRLAEPVLPRRLFVDEKERDVIRLPTRAGKPAESWTHAFKSVMGTAAVRTWGFLFGADRAGGGAQTLILGNPSKPSFGRGPETWRTRGRP